LQGCELAEDRHNHWTDLALKKLNKYTLPGLKTKTKEGLGCIVIFYYRDLIPLASDLA